MGLSQVTLFMHGMLQHLNLYTTNVHFVYTWLEITTGPGQSTNLLHERSTEAKQIDTSLLRVNIMSLIHTAKANTDCDVTKSTFLKNYVILQNAELTAWKCNIIFNEYTYR